MSKRTLTVQDIMLMQRQLEAAEQLNNILGQTVAEIGDVVSGIESTTVQDKKVAAALDKIKSAINNLEKKVEEFTKGLK
jgi:methyl-accepting chemotaxis protein